MLNILFGTVGTLVLIAVVVIMRRRHSKSNDVSLRSIEVLVEPSQVQRSNRAWRVATTQVSVN